MTFLFMQTDITNRSCEQKAKLCEKKSLTNPNKYLMISKTEKKMVFEDGDIKIFLFFFIFNSKCHRVDKPFVVRISNNYSTIK